MREYGGILPGISASATAGRGKMCILPNLEFWLTSSDLVCSTMSTLCLTNPMGADSPRRKGKSTKKMCNFHSATGHSRYVKQARKSLFWKERKNALAEHLSQVFSRISHFPEFYMRNPSPIAFDSFRASRPTRLTDRRLPLELIIYFVMALMVFSNVFLTRAVFFHFRYIA